MASSYNDRLKPISWKGECGDKEREDPIDKWATKAELFADWIRNSRYTVAFTGAGISVASGIKDFRGPNGVWTMEKKGLKAEFDIRFEDAEPSYTHMALVALEKKGYLHYVVSQNVDSLHLKSGLPRQKLSELHGNIFAEHCDQCNTEYIRDYDVGGMGCKPTGRMCERPGCGYPLRDTLLDWDTPLPELEFERAIEAHKQADLAICLGTSLRIRPAGNMPLRTLRKHKKDAPGKLIICNLQKTHLDRNATLRFYTRVDNLMREVCRLLDVEVQFNGYGTKKKNKEEEKNDIKNETEGPVASIASTTEAAAAAATSSVSLSSPSIPTPAASSSSSTIDSRKRTHTESSSSPSSDSSSPVGEISHPKQEHPTTTTTTATKNKKMKLDPDEKKSAAKPSPSP